MSKHAAALECSCVLVFKVRDVWPMYTAAQSLHLILQTVPLVSSFFSVDLSEKALKSLAEDPSVTILPVYKGRCVVVMNTSDYADKIMKHLQDENTYKK